MGPFYLASAPVTVQRVPIHSVNIVEITRPWRSGKALVFPWGRYNAAIVGWWTRNIDQDVEEDFQDDVWIKPQWLTTPVEDISSWKIDDEVWEFEDEESEEETPESEL